MEPSPSPKPSNGISAPRKSVRAAELRLDPRGLLPAGTPSLIGVSGGRDSVALLHALLARGERDFVVCHFDHALRAESATEAAFVEELARSCRLPFERTRAKPACQKQSVETAAREARYVFFAEVAARRGCPHLYLAHHADDQAETLLFNLLRGSGTAGLCGMRPVSQRGSLVLHRPLLGTWRAEIDRYVAAHALGFCEDASNRDPQHTRNRLRHEIIPALEERLGRKVGPALWRAAEILSAEDDLLLAQTPAVSHSASLEAATVRALPLALQRRLARAWLQENGVPEVSFEVIESILRLLRERSPAKINLAAGGHVRRRAGRLFLELPASPRGA